jgi:hypothetical protein
VPERESPRACQRRVQEFGASSQEFVVRFGNVMCNGQRLPIERCRLIVLPTPPSDFPEGGEPVALRPTVTNQTGNGENLGEALLRLGVVTEAVRHFA